MNRNNYSLPDIYDTCLRFGTDSQEYLLSFLQGKVTMRQYNRVKQQRGKKFSYHDLKPVCIIVIMESGSNKFLQAAPAYIHREQISYDSGACP